MRAQREMSVELAAALAESEQWEARHKELSEAMAQLQMEKATEMQVAANTTRHLEERWNNEQAALSAEVASATARAEGAELERAALAEQAAGAVEKASDLARELEQSTKMLESCGNVSLKHRMRPPTTSSIWWLR